MSTPTNPLPHVIDPSVLPSGGHDFKLLVGPDGLLDLQHDVAVTLSREHARTLALALHEFDRAGAFLPYPMKILRDQLDRVLTSRAEPPLEGKALLEARRKRREGLWRMMLDEEKVLCAGDAICEDLHPSLERAEAARIQAVIEDSKDSITRELRRVNEPEPREDWQC